jgi:hypothetical protein
MQKEVWCNPICQFMLLLLGRLKSYSENNCRDGRMTQVVESLCSKCEALSSNSILPTKTNQTNKNLPIPVSFQCFLMGVLKFQILYWDLGSILSWFCTGGRWVWFWSSICWRSHLFSNVCFLVPLPNMRRLKLYAFIFDSSVLSHWSFQSVFVPVPCCFGV